ncbi:MAG TPA: thioredoxin domain-containing protein, partial [Longimicrobium sp.]
MPNRLADETSPYLLQHRDNPVDWYPWGPEALERARAEDLPILLSVGYSACHWCHVMEHESFEDEATAALMNQHFVSIKVDREERPDIDSIYMAAVQGMTGHGGWPMTVFLTPEGVPFYGGTYFPPEPRHGLPSFRQLLGAMAQAWRERRGDVDRSAEEIRASLMSGGALRAPAGPLSISIVERAAHQLATRFDARWGGFGSAPKFPQPMTIDVLLRHWKRVASPEALQMASHTLRMMHAGGMYDHVGGGFARYSVDAQWLVPHFEKMLYDNALLARAYLHGYQATGDASFRAVVEETLDFTLRELTGPEGGFYSSLDADSEGEEGRFYLWTPEQIDEVVGAEDGALVRGWFGVTDEGNFEGRNIPHTWRDPVEVAADAGVTVDELQAAIARARPLLYEARAQRVWPGRDDKVLTSWNAMMLHALADAARVLDRPDYLEAAIRNADFLLTTLR